MSEKGNLVGTLEGMIVDAIDTARNYPNEPVVEQLRDSILELFKGYVKLPESLPVLTDEELLRSEAAALIAWRSRGEFERAVLAGEFAFSQARDRLLRKAHAAAQCDADLKAVREKHTPCNPPGENK